MGERRTERHGARLQGLIGALLAAAAALPGSAMAQDEVERHRGDIRAAAREQRAAQAPQPQQAQVQARDVGRAGRRDDGPRPSAPPPGDGQRFGQQRPEGARFGGNRGDDAQARQQWQRGPARVGNDAVRPADAARNEAREPTGGYAGTDWRNRAGRGDDAGDRGRRDRGQDARPGQPVNGTAFRDGRQNRDAWRGDDRPGDNRRFAGDRGAPARAWNRDWRNDGRYDWNRYRDAHRSSFRLPRYYAPYQWSYGYRRFGIGATLASILWAEDYWIDDPYEYRLPPVEWPYRWVRYYDDALLVDVRSGYVVDTVYDIFG